MLILFKINAIVLASIVFYGAMKSVLVAEDKKENKGISAVAFAMATGNLLFVLTVVLNGWS